MSYAQTLIDNGREDLIDAIYDHFENGLPAPEGVTVGKTFRATMGRIWFWTENGLKTVPYTSNATG